MKKIIGVCFSVILLFFLSISLNGCKNLKTFQSVWKDNYDFRNEIQARFDNRDVNGLYDLFSDEAKRDQYLKSRIKILMYYWDSLDLDDSKARRRDNSGGKTMINGEYTHYLDEMELDYYSDKYGNPYCVSFYIVSIDKDHPQKVGITDITISSVNTIVYSTSIDKTEQRVKVNNYEDRIMNIIDRINAMREKTDYVQSSDNERIVIARNTIECLVQEENEKYGDSVIALQSIEETNSDDSFHFYPALIFHFIDGSTFLIIVHNNP